MGEMLSVRGCKLNSRGESLGLGTRLAKPYALVTTSSCTGTVVDSQGTKDRRGSESAEARERRERVRNRRTQKAQRPDAHITQNLKTHKLRNYKGFYVASYTPGPIL